MDSVTPVAMTEFLQAAEDQQYRATEWAKINIKDQQRLADFGQGFQQGFNQALRWLRENHHVQVKV